MVVALASVSVAAAQPNTDPSRTPLSCDGKQADFHAERAKAVISKAFGADRLLSPEPAKRSEKDAWRSHRRCLLDQERRLRIGRYVDRKQGSFAATFAAHISPPGAITLAARRACENGGSYGNDGNGDAYLNAYQFDTSSWAGTASTFTARTGLPANPSRLAVPREQDIRAAIWDQITSGDPWPNCP